MSQHIINGVFGLAINSKRQVLLSQRHQPQSPHVHLKWQIPGGGQEFGEHFEETLKREMQEELGVDVTVLDPRPVIKTSIWPSEKEEGSSTQVNLITYIVSIGDQTPMVNDEETNDFAWVDPNDVASLDTLPQVGDIVAQALAIIDTRSIV